MKQHIKDFLFLLLYYSFHLFRKRERKIPATDKANILVISWQLIGDSFLSLPVIYSLKKYFTNSKITVLSKPTTRDIFAQVAEIDKVISISDNKLSCINTIRKLRKKYDLVIDLTNNRPSAFLSLLANGKYRIGGSGIYKLLGKKYYGFPLLYDKMLPSPENEYSIDYMTRIVKQAVNSFEIDYSWKFGSHTDIAKNPDNKIHVGFGIGASRNENLWEDSNWIELAQKLTLDKNVVVHFFGGEEERKRFPHLNNILNEQIKSWIGKTSLQDAIEKIKCLDYFISNDTGLMHVAVHFDIPTICLVGPSNPANYFPKKNPRVMIVKKNLFCQPCYNYLKTAELSIHHDCKTSTSLCKKLISVQDIFTAYKRLRASLILN